MFDILFRNAKVIDGTGNPWFYGDVGVEGGTVAAVLCLAGLIYLLARRNRYDENHLSISSVAAATAK